MAERDPDAPTGLMLKERRTPALTRVSYHRAASAASRATVSDLDEDAIRAAALLHLTGITPALSDSARALTLHAARVAREAAVPVSFDLNYRSALWSRPRARDCFRTLIPLADVVFAGEDEAALALDRSPDDVPSLAEGLASMGPSEAVIKRGAKGAFARVDGRSFEQDAVRIDPIDTVGAGDAFVAGYLAERLNGVPVPERLETAVAVAAFVCLSEADWEGSPRRAEQAQLTPEDPVAR
ncbi:sugar kinase [Microbacterium sp. 4R-513]|uniref:sugar kinase n=1 Tax=Microbacterium sp. 4R-513 TaxID=2567934 RepID=UPI001F49C98C|nr:sugar kinase [Microbacterium sp. 4R-513]